MALVYIHDLRVPAENVFRHARLRLNNPTTCRQCRNMQLSVDRHSITGP